MTRLHYVGDGTRYIHEDLPAGIPQMPAADFDTDNPVAIALGIESGLYVVDDGSKKAAEAAEAAPSATETDAAASSSDESDGSRRRRSSSEA